MAKGKKLGKDEKLLLTGAAAGLVVWWWYFRFLPGRLGGAHRPGFIIGDGPIRYTAPGSEVNRLRFGGTANDGTERYRGIGEVF
jgi:hypothetical protein